MPIPHDQLARLKAAVNLVELVGETTPVRKAGANYVAHCPIHGPERTPSFTIYPEGRWHCYGCGKGGDELQYMRDLHGLGFLDAAEQLARRAGIRLDIHRDAAEAGQPSRERMVAAWQEGCGFQAEQFWDAPGTRAREYLTGRGLTQTTLEAFGVGWAPGRGLLCGNLALLGFTDAELIAAGLAVEKDGHLRDAAWNRITFPILDRFGQPVAVTARARPEDEAKAKAEGRHCPKDTNTAETRLYHKGSTLFNFRRAREACRKTGRLVVVEGPLDAMAAHQAGVPETVATLGTALTPEHAKLLGQALGDAGRLILLPDADAAGQAAAEKAIATLWAAGLDCQVASLAAIPPPAEVLAHV
jgi:DNA primase